MSPLAATLARVQHWDLRLCLSFNRLTRVRVLLQFFRAVSWLGNGIFWYALMLGLMIVNPDAAVAPVLQMGLTGLVCTLTYKLLKRGTQRPRPFEVQQQIDAGVQPLDEYSFPSGHTLHAVAFTLIACAHYPQLASVTVPFTLLTAASRMVLGLHYPTDVLAGGALGALIAMLSLSL